MFALHFAAKVLTTLAALALVLLTVRVAFDFSRWTGFLAVSLVAVALYLTAHRWISALPGLLVFGVFSSIIGLITHRAPNSPGPVSTAFAALMLIFFSVGTTISYRYDDRVSPLDRCAFIIYCGSIVWAVMTNDARKNLGIVTFPILYPLVIGMAAIVIAFAIRRTQRTNRGRMAHSSSE